MSVTADRRALCPISSSSSSHYRSDGSCRCRDDGSANVAWLLGNARNYLDQRSELTHIGDRMLSDAVEMLDAYREALVRIAGRGTASDSAEGIVNYYEALEALTATAGEGPVYIPVSDRAHIGDRTIAEKKARLRREQREQAP